MFEDQWREAEGPIGADLGCELALCPALGGKPSCFAALEVVWFYFVPLVLFDFIARLAVAEFLFLPL